MRATFDRLKDAAGPNGFTEDAREIAPYLEEWRGRAHGKSALLLRPATTEQVSAILAICHETGTPIVPQGGNTGLVGGQIPLHGEVLLSLGRLNRIRHLDAPGMTLTAEAGVTLKQAQDAASAAHLLFPLTLGSEGSCTIGGNISTNAGGNHVLRYGMMRALVLGLEVVLADGRVLPMLKSLHKDNTGYDLKQIFIGAEGTLGIVTAASLKLFPQPVQMTTAFTALPSPSAALSLLGHMQTSTGGLLSSFELISRQTLELVLRHIPGTRDPLSAAAPWYVLMEISGGAGANLEALTQSALEEAMAQDLVTDAVVAQNQAQARSFWHMRESMSEAEKREGVSIKHDISVPVASIPAFIAEATAAVVARFPGARPVCFGHMGDGNLHFNFNAPPGQDTAFAEEWDEVQLTVHDIVKSYAGSISAEHGIGRLKRDLLPRYKSSEELDAMRALKAAFDPKNILNPGKTVPPVTRL
ncbi:MAG TPA: FAD-binding oxidoreductase [Rhizomicrobium sp.]|jgi:FAD/FMN-containing dehydrogenase|nr:FAD-binding oxidoreductase [Rhizomicrobium sp.]